MSDDQQGGDLPKSATTYSAALDAEYPLKSLEQMQAAVKGNGVKPENIEIKSFEGESLEFICTTRLELKTKVLEKTMAGKVTGPEQVSNPQMMREAIEKEKNKVTHREDVIKRIKDVILEREDKGFGIDNELIKLPFLHKEFVYYDPCNVCRSRGHVNCARCHGQGYEMCPHCQGQGYESCPQCRGQQQIPGPQGGMQPCPRCHGQGKQPCSKCQQSRKIQCPVCKTKGTTQCKQCNGHAWNSHIAHVEMDAVGFFDFDREAVPDKIETLIDRLGPDLVDHVDMKPIIMEKEKEQELNEIIMPYLVRLPHGNIIYEIKHKPVPGFLFGIHGRLMDSPPFLEKIIAPGLKLLELAASGQGSVAEHIRKASRYRTIRQTVIAAARFSLVKAIKAVLHNNPIGIEAETAEEMVIQADRALKNITNKPRQIGMALGLLLATGLYGAYFHAGLRDGLTASIPNISIHPVLDILMMAMGAILSVLSIQVAGAGAMKKALQGLIPPGKKGMPLPKSGKKGFYAAMIAIVLFMGVLESTVHTGAQIPEWYAGMRLGF